jgi:acetyl-CoA carboxylase biotin carboxyl carrier protein
VTESPRSAALGGVDATWLEAVRRVVAAVRASDVTDLEIAQGNFSIRLRREPGQASSTALLVDDNTNEAHLHRVVAPFTGVFYRSPTPSARSYVMEGDWVDGDAVIGLVETMKIFNEVTADFSGRIVRFQADNGQLVHAGDPLVLIEPGERTTAESGPHP